MKGAAIVFLNKFLIIFLNILLIIFLNKHISYYVSDYISDCLFSFSDIILAVTFFVDGRLYLSIVTLLLVLLPNAIVQIFSARWNKIDDIFNWPLAIVHALLLGTLHRYDKLHIFTKMYIINTP